MFFQHSINATGHSNPATPFCFASNQGKWTNKTTLHNFNPDLLPGKYSTMDPLFEWEAGGKSVLKRAEKEKKQDYCQLAKLSLWEKGKAESAGIW